LAFLLRRPDCFKPKVISDKGGFAYLTFPVTAGLFPACAIVRVRRHGGEIGEPSAAEYICLSNRHQNRFKSKTIAFHIILAC
jgi:hypothetical protein